MPVTAPTDRYREALERLYGLERGKHGPFGLEGTQALLEELGHPERAFRAIHVAGTNGKGSTCALIERILRAAGTRTGLFTSPHLVDFRERIRVDGRAAAPEAVARDLARITSVPAGSRRTFFEATFALGALAFAQARVDTAVLETGLGGRLDATNVIRPALSVITRIGLDHQEMLGGTLEAIAAEKAGIIKPETPVVVAGQEPGVLEVLKARAASIRAPFHRAEDLVRVSLVHALDRTGSDLTLEVRGLGAVRTRLALPGRHQLENAAVATAAALLYDPTLSREALAEGLAHARWPGRFEAAPSEPRLFWDGAHNPQGARALREAWREVLADVPGALVLGMSEDKDAPAMLDALEGPWRRVFAVAARAPRARPALDVAADVRAAWPGTPVTAAESVADGVAQALASLGLGECALACGSLFVVGEAMAALGAPDLEQL